MYVHIYVSIHTYICGEREKERFILRHWLSITMRTDKWDTCKVASYWKLRQVDAQSWSKILPWELQDLPSSMTGGGWIVSWRVTSFTKSWLTVDVCHICEMPPWQPPTKQHSLVARQADTQGYWHGYIMQTVQKFPSNWEVSGMLSACGPQQHHGSRGRLEWTP